MDHPKYVRSFTLLLASVAGFCDTATFLSGKSIFSAHVTGNFIVFAVHVIVGRDPDAWVKLLTFPVFVIAVMIGGWLAEKFHSKYFLLWAESMLLLACGPLALLSHYFSHTNRLMYGIVLMAVFSMGLQNAFGKLYAKETYGPTTLMTGNITQAALDLGRLLRNDVSAETAQSFEKHLFTVSSFLTGCLLGALASSFFGLVSVTVPGLALFLGCRVMRKNTDVQP